MCYFAAAVHAVQTDGVVKGLFRGFVPQALRNGAWNGTYFGVIGYLRAQFPSAQSDKLQSFAIGVVGGAAGTSLNTPLDVVKSRMQVSGYIVFDLFFFCFVFVFRMPWYR
jgi:solute carrier family 25 2-oxodicarboxylate transporter 21